MIQSIVKRLRECLEADVFGAAEFYHAQEQAAFTGDTTYFVLPNTEQASGFRANDVFRINNQVRVIVRAQAVPQDFRAEKSFFDATKEREKLFASLLGWQAGPCFEVTEYIGGALLGSSKAGLFYAYTFNFPEQVDSCNPNAAEPVKIRMQIKDNCAC